MGFRAKGCRKSLNLLPENDPLSSKEVFKQMKLYSSWAVFACVIFRASTALCWSNDLIYRGPIKAGKVFSRYLRGRRHPSLTLRIHMSTRCFAHRTYLQKLRVVSYCKRKFPHFFIEGHNTIEIDILTPSVAGRKSAVYMFLARQYHFYDCMTEFPGLSTRVRVHCFPTAIFSRFRTNLKPLRSFQYLIAYCRSLAPY